MTPKSRGPQLKELCSTQRQQSELKIPDGGDRQLLKQRPEEIYEIKNIRIGKTGRDRDLQCLKQVSGKFMGENYFSHWNPNARKSLNYYSERDVPVCKDLQL